MSSSNDSLGDAMFTLAIWRACRRLGYRLIGIIRPGWRSALPLLRLRDRYADKSTMAVAVYSDPRFHENTRAIEHELRRVRKGGPTAPFKLPYDFPAGSQQLVTDLLGPG